MILALFNVKLADFLVLPDPFKNCRKGEKYLRIADNFKNAAQIPTKNLKQITDVTFFYHTMTELGYDYEFLLKISKYITKYI